MAQILCFLLSVYHATKLPARKAAGEITENDCINTWIKGTSESTLDQPPCLPHQLGGLVDFRFGGVIPGIGLMGKLVYIISNGGQFPEQGGIAIGRAGTKIDAHDELTQQRLHFQAGCLCLLFQVAIFIGAEPQGDGLKYFAHLDLLIGHRRNGAAAVWDGDG